MFRDKINNLMSLSVKQLQLKSYNIYLKIKLQYGWDFLSLSKYSNLLKIANMAALQIVNVYNIPPYA